MGIIKIRATKPSPDSKIGIKYQSDGMEMTITGIFEDSIFASTDLKVGHEVVRINEASVYGKPFDWIKVMLSSIEDEVELDVRVNEDTKDYIQVRATKPTPDAKLGIKYVAGGQSLVITGILPDSIFTSTRLKVGHEVFMINGTTVAGNDRNWINTILSSITDTIIFDVKNTWAASVKIVTKGKVPVHNNRVGGTDKVRWLLETVLDAKRSEAPLFFIGQGIPIDEWERIYDAINDDLVPVIAESRIINENLRKEMGVYRSKQVSKGWVEADRGSLEAKHEAKVFRMTQTAATMESTCTLVATNVLSYVSSIVAPYSVRCELELEEYELPKYSFTKQRNTFKAKRVNGIKFIPVVQRTVPNAMVLPVEMAELIL